MSTREVMQLALDALEKSNAAYRGYGEYISQIDVDATAKAITELKAELAKPEPEPVGYFIEYPGNEYARHTFKQFADMYAGDVESVPLYRNEDL